MKLIDSAIIMTLATGFLYCASTAYTHGYFGVFDLNTTILDRNLHEILYQGLLLNIWTILVAPLVLLIIITIHSLYKIYLSEKIHKSFEGGRDIVKLKKLFNCPRKKTRTIEKKYTIRIVNAAIISVFSFAFIISMAIFEQQGKTKAQELLVSIQNNRFKRVDLGHQNLATNLAYLFCGSSHCAAYHLKDDKIVYFSHTGLIYSNPNLLQSATPALETTE